MSQIETVIETHCQKSDRLDVKSAGTYASMGGKKKANIKKVLSEENEDWMKE